MKTVLHTACSVSDSLRSAMESRLPLSPFDPSNPTAGTDILVIEAADAVEEDNEQLVKDCFQNGTSLLLLKPDRFSKALLSKHIGFNTGDESEAWFVSVKRSSSGKVERHVVSFGNEGPLLREASGDANNPIRIEGSKGATEREQSLEPEEQPPSVEQPTPEEIERRHAEQFVETMIEAHERKADEHVGVEPKKSKWVYTRVYNWSANEAAERDGVKPKEQTNNGVVTYEIIAFLDETAGGSFEWVTMTTNGYWQTGGMKKNDRSERGWSTGSINYKVTSPEGFTIVESSPTNSSAVEEVTTSVGFTVGTDAGSFNYSRTKTEYIHDWKIIQNGLNEWNYFQNSPFKGNTAEFPDDAIEYNAGKVRYEVSELPTLSRTVISFTMMSVWRNQTDSKAKVLITPSLQLQYNYVSSETFFFVDTNWWWWQKKGGSLPGLEVDLALVA